MGPGTHMGTQQAQSVSVAFIFFKLVKSLSGTIHSDGLICLFDALIDSS